MSPAFPPGYPHAIPRPRVLAATAALLCLALITPAGCTCASGTTSDSGGTASPDSGGTASPDSGGTASPDSGGTAAPDSGGGGGGTFACGTTSCVSGAQYCEHFYPGVAGGMDTWSCLPLPTSCAAAPSCASCGFGGGPAGGCMCMESGAGDLTVTCFGV